MNEIPEVAEWTQDKVIVAIFQIKIPILKITMILSILFSISLINPVFGEQ